MAKLLNQLPQLRPRSADSHKGDFGRALLIGGSRGMSGAIALAGKATLRGGAGLVKLAVPDRIVETVASFDPCYMAIALPDGDQGRIEPPALEVIRDEAAAADCVAIGPGLGRSEALTELVTELYRSHQGPLVLDADALNALASSSTGLAGAAGPRILTPHPGEFSRLIGGEKLSREAAIERAEQLAIEHGVVLVLKGNQTLVTDGRQSYRNATGNPGMATGGTGDCLTGIITALVCQQLSPFDAAVLGVHVHGRAGDLAAQQVGQVALIASDLLDYLAEALRGKAER
jgi:ADP-dependent NAD(P)H-hydrate dehydratase